eukprot:213969_1
MSSFDFDDLCALGFEPYWVTQALELTNHVKDYALEWLLSDEFRRAKEQFEIKQKETKPGLALPSQLAPTSQPPISHCKDPPLQQEFEGQAVVKSKAILTDFKKIAIDHLSDHSDDFKEDPDDCKHVISYIKTQRMVQNLCIICIVIGEFTNEEDIPDVCRDVANYRNVSKKYKYKFMCSVDMKGNPGYKMTKQDVEDYIENECLSELIGGTRLKPKVQYDGLLVAFSSHGTLNSIVCSDSKKIAYSTIREWFQGQPVLRQIPRFYCVDACRVKDSKKVKKAAEEMQHLDDEDDLVLRGKGEAPSATIMGHTEGHTVRGGKVSKNLSKQCQVEKYQSI